MKYRLPLVIIEFMDSLNTPLTILYSVLDDAGAIQEDVDDIE
jgi:hypothetical protein